MGVIFYYSLCVRGGKASDAPYNLSLNKAGKFLKTLLESYFSIMEEIIDKQKCH